MAREKDQHMSGIRLAENLGNGFNLMGTNHDLLTDLIKA